jgi:hypothetical protein
MNLSPIVLFVYNRPEHTKKTLNALKQNKLTEESELFIFSDGEKNQEDKRKIKEVRGIINNINGFKNIEVFESEINKGLANSVIDGVTKIISGYGKVIVLEDDLITSENFLSYMNRALNFYEDNKDIWSISGYNFPIKIPDNYNFDVYLSYRFSSWGWGMWKDRWNKIDWEVRDYSQFINNSVAQKKFNRGGNDMTSMLKKQMDGKIDSWAIRCSYNQFKTNTFTIYPVNSKVKNIGLDGSGVHCGISNKFDVNLNNLGEKVEFSNDLELNKEILSNFKKYHNIGFKKRIIKKLKLDKLINKIKKI